MEFLTKSLTGLVVDYLELVKLIRSFSFVTHSKSAETLISTRAE